MPSFTLGMQTPHKTHKHCPHAYPHTYTTTHPLTPTRASHPQCLNLGILVGEQDEDGMDGVGGGAEAPDHALAWLANKEERELTLMRGQSSMVGGWVAGWWGCA